MPHIRPSIEVFVPVSLDPQGIELFVTEASQGRLDDRDGLDFSPYGIRVLVMKVRLESPVNEKTASRVSKPAARGAPS